MDCNYSNKKSDEMNYNKEEVKNILVIYDIKTSVPIYKRLKRRFYYYLQKDVKNYEFLSKSVILTNEQNISVFMKIFSKLGYENIDFHVVYFDSIIPKSMFILKTK